METKKQITLLVISITLITVAIFVFPLFFPSEKDKYAEEQNIKEAGNLDSAGRNHGEWKGFYKSGKESYRGIYQNGLKEGEWKYFNTMGQLVKIENYTKGLKNGDMLIYDDGKLYDRMPYVNEKKEGKHIHYTKNGAINYVQEFKNDSMNGEFVIYSSKGVITQKGRLKNAKNIGEWHMYNDEGVLTEINIYDSVGSTYRLIKLGLNQDTLSAKLLKTKALAGFF